MNNLRQLGPGGRARPARWTVRLTVLGTIAAIGILALFYATGYKPQAMRLMRMVSPMTAALPSLTGDMPLTTFNARLNDFLVILTMAIQYCAFGAVIDFLRWILRRRINAQ